MIKGTRNIAVLMGGPSAEHEISLKSGRGVVAALRRRGWPVTPVLLPHNLSVEDAAEFSRGRLVDARAEAAFLALHGPFGEDGTIQAVCDALGVAYTGSGAQASRLGLDKVESRKRFERAGLSVPKWHLLSPAKLQGVEEMLARLHFPVVVKPTNQGSSIGVSIAAHHGEFFNAVEEAARYDTRVLVEEFVRGREVTVGILGTRALPIVEIQSTHQFFDYTAKYTPGQTTYTVPAPLDPAVTRRVQACGLRAHRALRCRHFSRVDLILNDANEPVVLEVNTIPGLTATSLLPKAAAYRGLSYDALCEQLVLMAWDGRRNGHAPSRHFADSVVHA